MIASPFVRHADHTVQPADQALWCVIVNGALMIHRREHTYALPDAATLMASGVRLEYRELLGYVDDVPYFVGATPGINLTPEFELVDLRRAYGLLSEQEYSIVGLAAQIAHWEATSHFCSRCATPLERIPTERGKRCPSCGLSDYPRVSPAIIVLIHRDHQVLLTRKPEWPKDRYSLVAGFVEPGESLEGCLRREVLEEVGVTVDQIQYLGSQPWPFPHQLMVGFLAHYADGEITIDATELEHAAWFDLDALPHLPPPLSIARKIIDWFVARRNDPQLAFPE